jgi:histidyl-tRNA synthetase
MSKDKKRQIYKPKPISGFPEWLPELRVIEQQWLDKIRAVYESYGYCNIETPSVEELGVIAAKGEDVDKEIYVLERLQADPDDKKDARLALHFDQTVPFARYVAQNFNDLTFPFKRYQMQRVWRGERPQMGRMREFYQCDIDVINVDALPIAFDAEVAAICYEALAALDIGRVQLRISNRKILMGFLKSLGIHNQDDITTITRLLDKLEKVGEDQFLQSLVSAFEDDDKRSFLQACMAEFVSVARIFKTLDKDGHSKALEAFLDFTKDTSPSNSIDPQLIEGIDELNFVYENLSHLPEHAVVRDLTIVRGLDYYTGTVYETELLDVTEFTGSVCSGGRYDDLASSYINKKLPGVGISIGFTRLFDVLRQTGRITEGAKSPAQVLVALPSEDKRALASETARALRSRGMNVELYHAPQKIGKQIGYAQKKGIAYIWFPPFEDGLTHEVKDMDSGEQSEADPQTWELPA